MAFPINPVDGNTYVSKSGSTYVFRNGAWSLLTPGNSVAKIPLSHLIATTGSTVDISPITAVPFTSPEIIGSNISMPSSGSFVLKAGGRYRLEGMVKMNTGQTFAGFRWGTSPGNRVGTLGGSGSGSAIDANVTDGAAIAIVQPLVDTTYSLYLTGESGSVPLYYGNENLMGTYAVITQIDAATSVAVSSFVGATAGAAGSVGLVPAPQAGKNLNALRGNGLFDFLLDDTNVTSGGSNYIDIGKMRVQFGTAIYSGGTPTVTMPAAFANTNYFVTAQSNYNPGGATVFNRASKLNNSSFQVYFSYTSHTDNTNTIGQSYSWLAIGLKP